MARAQKLLIATTVCLALLVALEDFAEADCRLVLYRSLDMLALKIFMNADEYIYLNLVDHSDLPALMFYVNKHRVYVFDSQARPQIKSLDTLRTSEDNIMYRQFRYYETQFINSQLAARLRGPAVYIREFFGRTWLWLNRLQDNKYQISLDGVPSFGLHFKSDPVTNRPHYQIKSPLYDLTTHIDDNCRVRVYRQGTEINLAQLISIGRPPRSADNWNPMDPNSWTLFDRQQTGSSSSSSGGFRFARPLEPADPEDPDEAESLGGDLLP